MDRGVYKQGTRCMHMGPGVAIAASATYVPRRSRACLTGHPILRRTMWRRKSASHLKIISQSRTSPSVAGYGTCAQAPSSKTTSSHQAWRYVRLTINPSPSMVRDGLAPTRSNASSRRFLSRCSLSDGTLNAIGPCRARLLAHCSTDERRNGNV